MAAQGPAARQRLNARIGAGSAGVGFEEMRLENVGPIKRAAIGRHRVSVFVGPNNSGKSIALRLMHAACRLDLSADVQAGLGGGTAHGGAGGGGNAAAARAHAVLRGAGMEWPDIVTHSMPSGRLEVRADGPGGAVLHFGAGAPPDGAPALRPPPDPVLGGGSGGRSMYVPAGRTGTIPSLFTLMQVKSGLFEPVLRMLAEGRGRGLGHARPEASAPQPGIRGRMPEYLEAFYGIALEAFSGGLDERTAAMFSRVFRGSIRVSEAPGRSAIMYRDPLGFEVEIGSAASGIVSALLVMVAANRIGRAGTLTVEYPEEHIEPIRQLKLTAEIVRAALGSDASLVITTHSDFVVHAVLGMVRDGAVDSGDLGLYYFRRKRGSYTEVERVYVNGEGEAEMELFDEAIDALAYGSVVPNAP